MAFLKSYFSVGVTFTAIGLAVIVDSAAKETNSLETLIRCHNQNVTRVYQIDSTNAAYGYFRLNGTYPLMKALKDNQQRTITDEQRKKFDEEVNPKLNLELDQLLPILENSQNQYDQYLRDSHATSLESSSFSIIGYLLGDSKENGIFFKLGMALALTGLQCLNYAGMNSLIRRQKSK